MYWVHTLLRIIFNELNFLLTSLNINYLHPSLLVNHYSTVLSLQLETRRGQSNLPMLYFSSFLHSYLHYQIQNLLYRNYLSFCLFPYSSLDIRVFFLKTEASLNPPKTTSNIGNMLQIPLSTKKLSSLLRGLSRNIRPSGYFGLNV